MFAQTTTNGGDVGSRSLSGGVCLREVLLPHWRGDRLVSGQLLRVPAGAVVLSRCLSSCGALLSYVVLPHLFPSPSSSSSELGAFLFPVCAYLALHLARVPFPGPALGALASLCFLFRGNEARYWGGDISPRPWRGSSPSGSGWRWAIFFVGALRGGARDRHGHGYLVDGAYVSRSSGWARGYTLLWAGVASLAELVHARLVAGVVGALSGRCPGSPSSCRRLLAPPAAWVRGLDRRPTVTVWFIKDWTGDHAVDPMAGGDRRRGETLIAVGSCLVLAAASPST